MGRSTMVSMGGLPKIRGTFLGVPRIRTIVFRDLYWGHPILGNYRIQYSYYKHLSSLTMIFFSLLSLLVIMEAFVLRVPGIYARCNLSPSFFYISASSPKCVFLLSVLTPTGCGILRSRFGF